LGNVVDLVKNKFPECFMEDGDNAQLLLDRMEPEAFDEVMQMVHSLNIATEDRLSKRVKGE
jgi:hypothetical protein